MSENGGKGEKKGFFARLASGLTKTRENLSEKISAAKIICGVRWFTGRGLQMNRF